MCDKNLSLMLCEIWEKINNHQVKTDLQLSGLPRPPPSTLLGNQWIPKWVTHDWVWKKRLHEAGVWAQEGEVPSSASHGMRLCHPVPGFDRILLAHGSGLSCEFCWDPPFSPIGHLILRTDGDGQGWLIASPVVTLNSAYTWIVFYIPW